jgi:cytochrome c oxidase assembly protein subunit 15
MAILAATFGWIMVASGLIERPWVNAYKLSFHLCIAFLVYLALLYAYFYTIRCNIVPKVNIGIQNLFLFFLIVFWIQLFLGGVMSGMRVGVVYPTWPDMNGELIPQVLFNNSLWNVESFNNYDQNELLPALIHFLHRSFAYLVFILGNFIAYKLFKSNDILLKRSGIVLSIMLVIQVLLGIVTVISCIGEIPILWGVLHQFGALCLLTAVYVAYYISRNFNR